MVKLNWKPWHQVKSGVFKVLKAELDDDLYGVIVKVSEGRRRGHVPLCDLEVADKNDYNYWPVREYAVWFANRY